MDEPLKDKILDNLGLLAMQTCMDWPLDSVGGSNIYHVPASNWQAGELIKYKKVCTVLDASAFEQAAQNPDVRAIFVPQSANVTQSIARSILLRNPLSKQVFWEAQRADADAETTATVSGREAQRQEAANAKEWPI
jgi:hypothetical protein